LHFLGDIASHPDRFNAQIGDAHHRRALALAVSRGMSPLAAHCHLSLGKLYRRVGKCKRAQEHITSATAIYGGAGMTYWLEQAEAKMHQRQ
jgi:hypothetical protein